MSTVHSVYKDIESIINQFDTVTLEDMKGIRLMNRIDTKYLVNIERIKNVLIDSAQDYCVQEVNGERNILYHTVCYDTEDFKMYLAHQDGRKTREKIRLRTYVSSGLSFLEIKNKNNRGRTDKKRIKVSPEEDFLHSEETRQFLSKHAYFAPEALVPHLENRFSRMTLVNRGMTERLTIDTGLSFHNCSTGLDYSLDGIAIVELKRDGRTPSPMHDLFIRTHVHTMSFSKYCVGCALTDPALKQNRFKERIRWVLKMNEVSHV